MNRRELLARLGGAAIVWCGSARAQQRTLPLVAFLSPRTSAANIDVFRRSLHELGYVEGQNISLEARSAEGDNRRLPALAAELAALKPDVIVTNRRAGDTRREGGGPAPSRSSRRSSATQWLSASRKAWRTPAAI